MNRLQTELQRLFGATAPGVRALMLELARPADWGALVAVWRGVQTELDLPAPAIAVTGHDGMQLWFSLAAPVSREQGLAFLQALQARYLGQVAKDRLRTQPAADPSMAELVLPPVQVGPERWSAFIAPDLAPLFNDEPWLNEPVGADAQADLLSRHVPAAPAAFAKAYETLLNAAARQAAAPASAPAPEPAGGAPDPRQFLTGVMNDPQAPLALRIEAAKALLSAPMR